VARQKAAGRILALGVGLDWHKLTLTDLQQIEKDLKATADDPDAHARVIVAARLRELGVSVDWRRFTSQQLADLYITALGAEKGRAASAEPSPAPAVPTLPTAPTPELPPNTLDQTPYVPPAAYDFGAANVLPSSPVVYYSPPPAYFPSPLPLYSPTYYIPRPYAYNNHGTVGVLPAPPHPFHPACPPRPTYFHRPGIYPQTAIVTGGRPLSTGSFVPNGRSVNTVAPAAPRPVTITAPRPVTFSMSPRVGAIGFTPHR
jgi:hypothetical protein